MDTNLSYRCPSFTGQPKHGRNHDSNANPRPAAGAVGTIFTSPQGQGHRSLGALPCPHAVCPDFLWREVYLRVQESGRGIAESSGPAQGSIPGARRRRRGPRVRSLRRDRRPGDQDENRRPPQGCGRRPRRRRHRVTLRRAAERLERRHDRAGSRALVDTGLRCETFELRPVRGFCGQGGRQWIARGNGRGSGPRQPGSSVWLRRARLPGGDPHPPDRVRIGGRHGAAIERRRFRLDHGLRPHCAGRERLETA